MSKNIQIVQLREHDLNRGASKDSTPVFPITKASAIEGMSEFLEKLNINGVTPISDISDVNSPEKGKIYYEESTDKYYVYSEDKSSFVELGAGTSVDPSDLMPTITQEASTQSGGDNIVTFTFPNGTTSQITIKNGTQGAQGDSGYTGAANELRVANSLDDDDPTAAISAACANELKVKGFVETGSFGDAYDKAKENNVTFPWLLDDIDKKGNEITKMIWHVGDCIFVDAIGAKIDGQKNGITVEMSDGGTLYLYKPNDNSSSNRISFPLVVGENNISIKEIASAAQTANWGESYSDGTIVGRIEVSPVANVLTLDCGNIKVQMLNKNSDALSWFYRWSNITKIDRLNLDVRANTNISWMFYDCPKLTYIKAKGTLSCTSFYQCFWNTNNGAQIYYDLKDLTIDSRLTTLDAFIKPNTSASVADVRGLDTSNVTQIKGYSFAIKTLIIGNFSTESIDTSLTQSMNTINTVVCTTDEPPFYCEEGETPPLDWLANTTTILIPDKNVDVDGVATPLIDVYKAAPGWSNYVAKMKKYDKTVLDSKRQIVIVEDDN